MAIKLLVGLGNPGATYDKTRHNAGFWFLDRVANRYNARFQCENRFQGEVAQCRTEEGAVLLLLKPQTFMNRSGQSVQAVMGFHKLALGEVMVVHDELDLSPGVARLKQGGGHAGHNGLRDIMARCGGGEFVRLRLGIGRPVGAMAVADYVLAKPAAAERSDIEQAMDRGDAVLRQVLAGNVQEAMQKLHQ